jgi:ABC-type bacteriocin/lantibiotic exporter with double-glycine peptidase domain
MSIKQLLKSIWLYSWVLIVPLAILASFTDLLLLGGIRVFLTIITDSHKYIFHHDWIKDIEISHWIVIMFGIIIMRYLFITIRARSEERLSHRLESHLRAWWIRMVKDLHPLVFHNHESDGILYNANHSVSAMPKGCKIITQSIQAISQLLFFVPVLFYISWQLTLVLLFVFTPLVLYLQKSFKKSRKGIDNFNQFAGEYNSTLWQWVNLKKCWNNQTELSKYTSLLFSEIRSLRNASAKMSVGDATIMQGIETISISIMCIVLAVCAALIQMHLMEPFQIILFCAALLICYKPLKECSQIFPNLRDLRIAYTRLQKLENMERSRKFIKEKDDDCIKIEGLNFKYGNPEPWVFLDLNNVIKLNRPMVLKGENGSGKTTLLRILSGLEIPQGGKIFMPPKAKLGSFYFSQRLFLPPISWLEKTIKEKKWSDTTQKFFDSLDLDALMKKSGHSNGELQRIGLAWAVVSGAPFLFLDEPFAFIAKNLQEPIFKAFWNATTETNQWWMMSSHEALPAAYNDRVIHWKLGGE